MSSTSKGLLSVTVTAVGVVYGDIGTSPLYAMRECFFGSHAVAVTRDNVLGVLSLIVYALLLVISFKYIVLVMRADNRGEGGILALTSLIVPEAAAERGFKVVLVLLGIMGAALLYGDGMITPAITVLSAVEGLNVATPIFEPYVVPIALVILFAIFWIQQYGSGVVGSFFGPVMVVWFAVLAALGVASIAQDPMVLVAFDPAYAVQFFARNGWHGFAVLGAVFLVVTGGEALYADMGHFGKRPIQVAWFGLVLPALLLNYFGQGALLIANPQAAEQPFFLLAPAWLRLPLVVLATGAAVIASQALISGAFSLTRAAIQLGYAPRLDIDHTSSDAMGQVYVPQVNWFLAISTMLIVVAFRTSSSLAAAYGIAVAVTMTITGTLLPVVALERWRWPWPVVAAGTAIFALIDLSFVAANLLKILQGGWLPLVIAASLFTLMTTWKSGRRLVAARVTARATPLQAYVTTLVGSSIPRVPGTAVFLTAQAMGTPPTLAHNVRFNKILHECVIVLQVRTLRSPYLAAKHRVSMQQLTHGAYDVWLQYGFMEDPDIPRDMALIQAAGVPLDPEDLTYFVGRETLIATRRPGMAQWRERLFILMARNAGRLTKYFQLPPDRVVEVGVQVEV